MILYNAEINIMGNSFDSIVTQILFALNEMNPDEDHWFDGPAIYQWTGIKPKDINIAIDLLESNALITRMDFTGTHPYNFGRVKASSKGNYFYNEMKESPKLNSKEYTNEQIEPSYVDLGRLEELKGIKSSDFDLSRLIILCNELNNASKNGNYYSVIMLVRSIIDHIPPIFGKSNFQEVAGNISSRSFRDSMYHLDKSSRKIADSVLHTQIRKKEMHPNKTQVNFSNDLDVLLAEIARILG